MIAQLEPGYFRGVIDIFRGLDYHLTISAILGGSAPGKVFVDNVADPQSALVWTNRRFHLGGEAGNETFNREVRRLFTDTIYPQAKVAGQVAFSLFYDGRGWEQAISEIIFKDQQLLQVQREYYIFQQLKHDWRTLLPEGFRVHSVDARLLVNRQLKNLERLEAEMCSERESVPAFLAKSFGTCLIHGDTIAAWCLSEYNHGNRCEIGIETVEAYQRRGFATITASALIEHAQSQGLPRVGWDCYSGNTASGAAARAIGFVKDRDYPAYVAWVE